MDPRDLDNDRVLKLEVDTRPPEPGGWDLLTVVTVLAAVVIVIAVVVWYYRGHR